MVEKIYNTQQEVFMMKSVKDYLEKNWKNN